MKFKYEKIQIANIDIDLKTEIVDQQCFCTEISFSGNTFIYGDSKEDFINELKTIINKHRI